MKALFNEIKKLGLVENANKKKVRIVENSKNLVEPKSDAS